MPSVIFALILQVQYQRMLHAHGHNKPHGAKGRNTTVCKQAAMVSLTNCMYKPTLISVTHLIEVCLTLMSRPWTNAGLLAATTRGFGGCSIHLQVANIGLGRTW